MKTRIILSIMLLLAPMAHADYVTDTKTAELIEAIVAKYYDTYLLQPDKMGDFRIGSAFIDRFHKEGLVRILISLPDGTQKSFDFDDRFSTTKPTKIEPTSSAASRLSFVLSQSAISVTSTPYQSKHSPITYQVWTIDKP